MDMTEPGGAPGAQGQAGPGSNHGRRWPAEDTSRVPYWVYSDPEIYRIEMERIFYGPHWSYVGLEAEVPNPGDFKRSWIGERPVILARAEDGALSVVENRCAHRGVQFCQQSFGNAKEFVCPYHQWVYGLKGDLIGVPFRRGVKGQGGMPKDFRPEENGLRRLSVTTRNGLVWASFDASVPAFEDYLGPDVLRYYDRTYDGRALKVLGYSRQRIPANWKLMLENIKDPYHAGLLHVFFVTFGLFRADQKSSVEVDESGRHGVLVSIKGAQVRNEVTQDMRQFQEGLKLEDPRILDVVHEWKGEATVAMQTIFPSVILQQQVNSLSTRHIVPRGPGAFDFVWTHFGYADEDEAMTTRRLRQANLFGPAGLVSADDGEVIEMSQEGLAAYPDAVALVEMGGRDTGRTDHMVTETAIRAMYRYYRGVMGL